jgi:hypothetical protein
MAQRKSAGAVDRGAKREKTWRKPRKSSESEAAPSIISRSCRACWELMKRSTRIAWKYMPYRELTDAVEKIRKMKCEKSWADCLTALDACGYCKWNQWCQFGIYRRIFVGWGQRRENMTGGIE